VTSGRARAVFRWMSRCALVWFRRDLRVHDHPSLTAAHRACDRVVPVFVLDPRLLDAGRFPSANRAWFLLESLRELRRALRERGGELFVRAGRPEEVLPALARETGAEAVYFSSDVSPFAMARDQRTEAALDGVEVRRQPGNFVADVGAPRTADGRPFTVFSPFWRRWEKLPRREVHGSPRSLHVPDGLAAGDIPRAAPEAEQPFPPGEAAARERLRRWLDGPIDAYAERHDRLAGGTSELSPYLHFGCLSARDTEERARRRGGGGAAAFVRQLAWRDFYAHVLLHHPGNARHAHKREYDGLTWSDDGEAFDAWREGRTGFPVVDAGMRELRTRGWMHNRARLIAASFLTKDLHLDWRLGEGHFMRHLLCGDEAQNNGNWQWITSIGVDPQPYFRRMYNPAAQQRRHDPDGTYVRRWCPELRDVPLERLAEPWTMTDAEQAASDCVIGRDYPARIVDHQRERERAMERYRAIASAR
jgi:deoxyribodipyrimidine photo-lyase